MRSNNEFKTDAQELAETLVALFEDHQAQESSEPEEDINHFTRHNTYQPISKHLKPVDVHTDVNEDRISITIGNNIEAVLKNNNEDIDFSLFIEDNEIYNDFWTDQEDVSKFIARFLIPLMNGLYALGLHLKRVV